MTDSAEGLICWAFVFKETLGLRSGPSENYHKKKCGFESPNPMAYKKA